MSDIPRCQSNCGRSQRLEQLWWIYRTLLLVFIRLKLTSHLQDHPQQHCRFQSFRIGPKAGLTFGSIDGYIKAANVKLVDTSNAKMLQLSKRTTISLLDRKRHSRGMQTQDCQCCDNIYLYINKDEQLHELHC